ncbi:MAG: dihydroorotase [Desulfobacteraceae bacterium]|nr:dihydroorotase [Desulfobacteraceae bacterium]MBC2720878.1 dihydroorotase [Desulfobacteraceae bacterium]
MPVLIKGGRVIDPGNIDEIVDILIKDGKISEIKEQGSEIGGQRSEVRGQGAEIRIIDASGKIVTPGLIDMHVHLREPGHEYKETIESGCLSAAYGGFTAICPMPNTNPVNDNGQLTEYIFKKAVIADTVRVYPVAAISKGLNGKSLCEYGELKEAGAIALSDDGNPVSNSQLMRRAMEYAKGFSMLIISHCEDLDLAANGVVNEGSVATNMGLAGIPNAAESIMVMRDIALCELTGSRLHIAHVSTKESVQAIRNAKKRGVKVTAETAPHYFTLTEDAVKGYNTNAKMNPPLRSSQDREAILEGLADGTIDVIATDHAPHSYIEKEVEFDKAANGIIGLETSVSLSLKLVRDGVISLTGIVEKMSTNPAKILGLDIGIKTGRPADITIFDPDLSYKIDSGKFQSFSRNTPFNGWDMKGKAVLTMVGGKVVFEK